MSVITHQHELARALRRGRAVRVVLLSAALITSASSVRAQSAPAAAALDAMKRFDSWVGSWRGAGWSVGATGMRTEFKLTETVARRVGGKVLLVEGRGAAATGNEQGTVTHDGVVLVYYDEATRRYHWNGHEMASAPVDTELTFVDGGFAWSIKAAERGTTVRFTILIDQERWHELGEVSVDGAQWTRIMEVNLARQ